MRLSAGKKALVGALFWGAAAATVATAVAAISPASRARLEHVRSEAWRALRDPGPTYVALFPGGTEIERGDGVLEEVDGEFDRVGEVVRIRQLGLDTLVTLALDRAHGDVGLRQGARAVRRSQGRSFVFALQTLLTRERRERVAHLWDDFRGRYQAAVLEELKPLVSDLLQGAATEVEAALPAALARHAAEIDALLARLRQDVGHDQLLPLLTDEIWPIVVRHAQGPAETIGRELWSKVPLFEFALRAAADKVDRVLDKDAVHVEERWREFVRDEAVPILEQHVPEMTAALADVARELLADDEVHRRLSALLTGLASDPDAKRLTAELTRELLFENPAVAEFVRARLTEPAARERLQRVSTLLEEFLDPVSDLLLLDETGKGINPDLAKLIRLLLLKRDAQVIYLEPGDGPPLLPGSQIAGKNEF